MDKVKKSKFNEVDYSELHFDGKTIKSESNELKRLIKELDSRKPVEGDIVAVKIQLIKKDYKSNDSTLMIVDSVDIEKNKCNLKGYYRSKIDWFVENIDVNDVIISKYHIGYSPIDESNFSSVRPVAFQLSSILYSVGLSKYDFEKNPFFVKDSNMNDILVGECNFNPYIYTNGSVNKKEYYQRPFIWSVKDCQSLIHSLYEGIDCGKVIIRKHSFEEIRKFALLGETELFFKDVVDGKQRLTAIAKFIRNEFKDLNGKYWKELSFNDRDEILNSQLISYGEMSEETTDDETLNQFLKMNVFGVPQSKQHIEFVRKLKNNNKF